MSALARTALRSARAPAASFRAQAIQRRGVHIENIAGNATPFKHEKADRFSFGAKVAVFLISGAAIPVVASVYQLKKQGA